MQRRFDVIMALLSFHVSTGLWLIEHYEIPNLKQSCEGEATGTNRVPGYKQ